MTSTFRRNQRNAKLQQTESGPCDPLQMQGKTVRSHCPRAATIYFPFPDTDIPNSKLQINTKGPGLKQKVAHEENTRHQHRERSWTKTTRWAQKSSRSHAEQESQEKPDNGSWLWPGETFFTSNLAAKLILGNLLAVLTKALLPGRWDFQENQEQFQVPAITLPGAPIKKLDVSKQG